MYSSGFYPHSTPLTTLPPLFVHRRHRFMLFSPPRQPCSGTSPATFSDRQLGTLLYSHKHRNLKGVAMKVDKAVLDYGAHLRVADAPWVPMLDADTTVALSHVTQLAQFFVNLFIYFYFLIFYT
jgi:hypothetical protein